VVSPASPRAHLVIAGPRVCTLVTGIRLGFEDCYQRAGLDLLDKRVGGLVACITGPDHQLDGHPQSLLGAVGSVVNSLLRGLPDDEDVRVMGVGHAAGGSAAQEPKIRTSVHLAPRIHRRLPATAPRQEQQLDKRLDEAVGRIIAERLTFSPRSYSTQTASTA
jgi:hypothetical protein